MRTPTDIELVRAARGGSIDAAESLFERHWPLAWRAAYAVLGDRSLADDAAQRAAERALRSLDQFRGEGPFGPWLRRIAINQSVDMLRGNGREQPLPEDLLGADPYPEIVDRDAAIWAVSQLAAERRLVIVMRYWLDLDPPEIAAALELPVGTVSSRLSRALSDLRGLLEVRTR